MESGHSERVWQVGYAEVSHLFLGSSCTCFFAVYHRTVDHCIGEMVTFDKDGNPQSCDGCQQGPNPFVEQPPGAGYIGELAICADCGYAACSECQGHGCAAGIRCSGHGACKCTSCRQEVQRRMTRDCMNCVTGVFNGSRDPTTVQHHQLARGTCFCHNSNFGKAYSDMYPRNDLSSCVFGSKNSEKAYAGKAYCGSKLVHSLVRQAYSLQSSCR